MSGYNYSLGALFSEVAGKHASRPALLFADEHQVTYGELESISDQVAGFLKDRGVSSGSVVALFHDKSAYAYGTMIACLKLGAIYVNLDPNSPAERLKKIMTTCLPTVVLMGALRPEHNDFLNECSIYHFNEAEFLDEIAGYAETVPSDMPHTTGSDPAYLMFTSGSTGFPKGVVIPHSAVINFVHWSRASFSITASDTISGVNPPYFDNSVFDFYASIFNGAALAPVADNVVKRPREMIQAMQQQGCTIWFSVPSMFVFTVKMRALQHGELPDLRVVAFGGEGFPKAPLRQLYSLLGGQAEFINVYGPSECTCICSSYRVSADDLDSPELLPLGAIADNFSFRIMDADDNQISDGTIGELCLTGPQLGLGYYNNLPQTERAFVADPLVRGYPNRMYRTGDLVRYDEHTGLLWFGGRKDNQIKRMGYRIELEELEASLGSLSYLDEAICVYVQPDQGMPGKIVARVSPECDEKQVLEDLRHYLPAYMMPDIVRSFAVLPKNQNGKVDRKAIWEDEIKVLGL